METENTTCRPDPYRYLAALAAVCRHGLTSGDENEAMASIKAIAESCPRWMDQWAFADSVLDVEALASLPAGGSLVLTSAAG